MAERLVRLPEMNGAADGIAEVLKTASTRKEYAIPDVLMEKAFSLSLKTFASLQKKPGELPPQSTDWLGIAINLPGGKIAQFWLQYLSGIKGRSDEEWNGLPTAIKDLFRQVAQGGSDDAQLARLVLVSQLHYLFFLDQEFTSEVFIPLLNWSDQLCAAQCWQGFLGWGQWKKTFLGLIFPFYRQTLLHLAEFERRTAESFASHTATIAVYGFEDPLAEGWLYEFIATFNAGLRGQFAETIWRILEGMSSEASGELWDRWLKRYWEERLNNKPAALDVREMNQMLLWPLHLYGKFPEAVDLLIRSPEFEFTPVNVEKDIPSDLQNQFPNAVGEYLALLLRPHRRGFDQAKQIRDMLPELERAGLSQQIRQKIVDLLIRYNGPSL
jgi:Domain of unknown function (DUF4020)